MSCCIKGYGVRQLDQWARQWRVAGLSLLVLALLGLPAAPLRGQQEPAAPSAGQLPTPLPALELQDGDSIVFLGDSITHQCLYTQYVEDFFYTRFPRMRLKFHNAGVGGAKAWDALQRFDRDVAAYRPKYVTVLLGMNDGQYQPYNEEIFRTYQQDMTAVIERLNVIGARPILMTPTMFDARAARLNPRRRDSESTQLYNSVLAYYGTWLREVAVERGFGFVDMYSPLNNLTLAERKRTPEFTLIRDAVHPDPPGQLVMAYALLDDLGMRKPLSSIRIVPAKDNLVARTTGGEASDVRRTPTGVEFTWKAEALPFVLPEEAQLGAKLLNLGHRMSREALEVHGLEPGAYRLTIDGVDVGTYPAEALARHVELQANPRTPQYQQAARVAELNQQRNAGPVKSLRNEWRVFQQYARVKRQHDQAEDKTALAKQLESLEDKLKGLDERVAEHERQARAMEDQIFASNQPMARKYVLTRIERVR